MKNKYLFQYSQEPKRSYRSTSVYAILHVSKIKISNNNTFIPLPHDLLVSSVQFSHSVVSDSLRSHESLVRLPLMKFLPDKHHEYSTVPRRKKLISSCLVWTKHLGATWANQLRSLEEVISNWDTFNVPLGTTFNSRFFFFYYLSHNQYFQDKKEAYLFFFSSQTLLNCVIQMYSSFSKSYTHAHMCAHTPNKCTFLLSCLRGYIFTILSINYTPIKINVKKKKMDFVTSK